MSIIDHAPGYREPHAATTTKTGLRVHSRVHSRAYAKGRRITDSERAQVNIEPNAFHGEWNYTILPTPQVAA